MLNNNVNGIGINNKNYINGVSMKGKASLKESYRFSRMVYNVNDSMLNKPSTKLRSMLNILKASKDALKTELTCQFDKFIDKPFFERVEKILKAKK